MGWKESRRPRSLCMLEGVKSFAKEEDFRIVDEGKDFGSEK